MFIHKIDTFIENRNLKKKFQSLMIVSIFISIMTVLCNYKLKHAINKFKIKSNLNYNIIYRLNFIKCIHILICINVNEYFCKYNIFYENSDINIQSSYSKVIQLFLWASFQYIFLGGEGIFTAILRCI